MKEKQKHLKELEELRLSATKQAEEKVKSQFAFELRKIEEDAKEEKSSKKRRFWFFGKKKKPVEENTSEEASQE